MYKETQCFQSKGNFVKMMKPLFQIIFLAYLGLSISYADSEVIEGNSKRAGDVGGHSAMFVLMANGAYDPEDPDFTPPDFDYFVNEIMQWSDEEITMFEADAKAFFIEKFGVDVEDPLYVGRVMMVPFMLDPRWEYRAYHSTEEKIPGRGWVVRDGGFQLVAIDPNGVELGGEFHGRHVPQGAIAAFGIFNIARQTKSETSELIFHYQSREPVVQNSGFPLQRDGNGVLIAPFDIFSDEYGHGWGFGHIWDTVNGTNTLQTNNRNIITFPAGASYPY